jgi:hypothetical protein
MDHDLILSFAVIADPLSPHVPTSPLISSALTSVHRLSPNAMFTRRSLYAFFRASDLSCQCASGHCYLLALFHLIVTSHRHFSSSLLIVTSHRTFLHSGHDARTAAREDGKRGVAGLALSDTTPQPLQTSLAQQIRTHYSASTTPAPRWQCAVVIHATCALVSVQWNCRTVLTSLTPTR